MNEDEKPLKMDVISTLDDDFGLKQEKKLFKCYENAHIIKNRLKNYTNTEIEHAKEIINFYIERLKEEWPALFFDINYDKIYVHADLDAFYASCEILKNPSYKKIPIGIGSTVMLATSNYEARKFGVKAGMPGYMAKRLCPQLLIVKPNFTRYNYYSEMVMNVLSQYDKKIEIYGIDEACLVFDKEKLAHAYDVWNNDENFGKSISDEKEFDNHVFDGNLNLKNVEWIVNKIRKVVHRNTGLTISAGISVCRGLAKFGSDVNKPNGQFSIFEKFDEFLRPLKVDEINGIGKYTKEMLLKTFSIEKIGELRDNIHLLYLTLPEKSFLNLFKLSYGLISFDNEKMKKNLTITKSRAKDVSMMGTDNLRDLLDIMWDSSGDIESAMIRKRNFGSVITVRLRFVDFESLTRQKKLIHPIRSQVDIFNEACNLFQEIFNHEGKQGPLYKTFTTSKKINLLGIRLSELIDESKLNTIFSFNSNSKIAKSRKCPICTEEFFVESQIVVDRHVDKCLKKIQKKEKNFRRTLHYYIKK